MIPAWTGQEVRQAERPLLEAGNGPVLMARAAHGLALECVRQLRAVRSVPGARVVVLAGTGNNGGDAIWAAGALRRRGAMVQVIATGRELHHAAQAAAERAGVRVTALRKIGVATAVQLCCTADMVLDGIVGTGARGGLRADSKELVEQLLGRWSPVIPEAHLPVVVAVDIPSGVDADTGACEGPVLPAAHTVTFGGTKVGHLVPPGREASGKIAVVDIGIEHALPAPEVIRLDVADVMQLWPRPSTNDHKYTRGVLGVVAGSTQYPGAAVLCTRSAVSAGVGMVHYLGDHHARTMVVLTSPEVVASEAAPAAVCAQAWVAGPGATDQIQQDRIREVLDLEHPMVIDAGAFDVVGRVLGDRALMPQQILTPHAGELVKLLTWCHAWGHTETVPTRHDVERDPLTWARETASATGATVVLKGAVTVVAAAAGGPIFVVGHGSPWLATAGSGDCLAGILGALMANIQGSPDIFHSAARAWAVAAPLPPKARDQLLRHLTAGEYWALVAGVGVGLHAAASTVGGEGPQPCTPERIRAALTHSSCAV
ncbi:MAG: NAD(P)H-hydrate epimerase [Kocuria sp.]|nr:NAD(P)H-hydrate epimerase [Kocuria sp.]